MGNEKTVSLLIRLFRVAVSWRVPWRQSKTETSGRGRKGERGRVFLAYSNAVRKILLGCRENFSVSRVKKLLTRLYRLDTPGYVWLYPD